MNTAARKSTRAPASRDVNKDKKWGRFTSVVYAAMGSPPGSFQVSALRPLLEGGGIQLAEVHDLPVIGVIAHHEGPPRSGPEAGISEKSSFGAVFP